ncbi:hypothetical protein [Rhizobium sp. Root482]|uniref:hypothetical protein n=1 Tax=Rhizobium sp. Root482 TaxID=1736543 RepID=UPI000701A22E|nr:hypothetical protein [Rhizobium sp. Root482]KQY12632.1 hypothetical protein ASD31_15490 [Rhizobium sp. Root482]
MSKRRHKIRGQAVPLSALIQGDYDYISACIEADALAERGIGNGADDVPEYNVHDEIMAFRCRTLAEIRAKLAWMTGEGGGLSGEEEAFKLMLADIDDLLTTNSQLQKAARTPPDPTRSAGRQGVGAR